jgi:AraC-like DNA-binding protein
MLETSGVPVERYLERSRISPRVREHPVGYVPGRCVWTLVGSSSRGEGLGEWWLDFAARADWRRAVWARPMSRAATLGDAIRAMCAHYPREIPMNRMGLSVQGTTAWFWRRRVGDVRDWEGSDPAEMYTLSVMLAVVREAAGPAWLPEHLKVQCRPTGWPGTTTRLGGVRIQFDQPELAVAIPVALLALPVAIRTHSPTGDALESAATDFQGSLRQVLAPWLEGRLPDQQLAAELLWTSPRTLRRRLEEEGTSWRAVARDLIFSRAVERLLNSRSTVREIAEELGYSDAEHFTRFFRSRTGLPPSRYREQVERARELARGATP